MARGAACPPPLDEAEFARLFADLACETGPLLVAVSGGPDSTALLHALAGWAAAPGHPTIAVATVDHGIRPAARAEAEAVAAAARDLGLPHCILTCALGPGRVSQERARAARYERLTHHARHVGATGLLTAHTLDDQAETILMRAAAGSGLKGLGGMRDRVTRPGGLRHWRPFLAVPKARLVATCVANRWPFVDDPTNRDPRYARSRWRNLVPSLAAEGLDPVRLARLAERLRRADEALDELAGLALARCRVAHVESGIALAGSDLLNQPAEIGLRVLLMAIEFAAIEFAAIEQPGAAPGQSARPGTPVRLARAETCLSVLRDAFEHGRATRRTLGGCAIVLAPDALITISREPPRNRGRGSATAALVADRQPRSPQARRIPLASLIGAPRYDGHGDVEQVVLLRPSSGIDESR